MTTPREHLTAGVDPGSSAVKVAIMKSRAGAQATLLGESVQRIRRRNVADVARTAFDEACAAAHVAPRDLEYVASTGDGDAVGFRTGHFYSMTTHARGALFLDPEARAALDIGGLHARGLRMNEAGRVLAHRMTSQCASGSGQFLENIARYLGVAVEEIGPLSRTSANPEKVSSICAVLAETDVINMVSRGIATPDILKGIHLSMASRIVKLLKVTGVKDGVALMTGGLALDTGLVAATSHPDSIYAGAIGAALWGAFRHAKLQELKEKAAA
jgi:benzoyl-CoA reductase subunit D